MIFRTASQAFLCVVLLISATVSLSAIQYTAHWGTYSGDEMWTCSNVSDCNTFYTSTYEQYYLANNNPLYFSDYFLGHVWSNTCYASDDPINDFGDAAFSLDTYSTSFRVTFQLWTNNYKDNGTSACETKYIYFTAAEVDDSDDDTDCSDTNGDMLWLPGTDSGLTCYNGCQYEGDYINGNFLDLGGELITYQHWGNGQACEGSDVDGQDVADRDDGCITINEDNYFCETTEVTTDDSTGDQTENTCWGVYQLDGTQVSQECFNSDSEPEESCYYDTSASQFYCLAADNDNLPTGCTQINSYLQCYYTDPDTGEVTEIDPDSPDHPANGGNANGDTNDDTLADSGDGTVSGGGYGYGGGATDDDSSDTSQLSNEDKLNAQAIASAIDNALDNEFDGIQDSLDSIGEGVEAANDQLSGINDQLQDINDTLNTTATYGDSGLKTEQEYVDDISGQVVDGLTDNPIVNNFQSLADAFDQNQGAACPTYDLYLAVFDKTFTFDGHCLVAEENRDLIGALMVTLFTVGGFMIIIRA